MNKIIYIVRLVIDSISQRQKSYLNMLGAKNHGLTLLQFWEMGQSFDIGLEKV